MSESNSDSEWELYTNEEMRLALAHNRALKRMEGAFFRRIAATRKKIRKARVGQSATGHYSILSFYQCVSPNRLKSFGNWSLAKRT